MARQNRIHLTSVIVYVTVRCHKDKACFSEPCDYDRWQSLVSRALVRCRARLLAYCCLRQSAHLVIRLSDVPLESFMRHLSGPYSRYLHRERGWQGRVYQSRYRTVVIDADFYLLHLLRYVHLLPVTDGLCGDASGYAWSSDRAYRDAEKIPWLAKAEVLEALQQRDRNVTRGYRLLMREAQIKSITAQFEHGSRADSRVAGGVAFMGALERRSAHQHMPAEEVLAAVCRWQSVVPAELFSRPLSRHSALVRSLVVWHLLGGGDANLANVAKWFGVRRWTLRASIERHRTRRPDLFDVPLARILAPKPSLTGNFDRPASGRPKGPNEREEVSQ